MAAGKGKWLKPKQLAAPDFWEPVKPSNVEPSKRPGWMTYDDAFVDEVKRGLRACKVFIWYPLWWLTYNQVSFLGPAARRHRFCISAVPVAPADPQTAYSATTTWFPKPPFLTQTVFRMIS